jgi:hypothetical protein
LANAVRERGRLTVVMWLAGSVSAMQLAVAAILLRMGLTDVNFAMCRTALKLRLPVDGAAIPMATLPISLGAPRCGFRSTAPVSDGDQAADADPVAVLPWCFPGGEILVLTVDSFNIT